MFTPHTFLVSLVNQAGITDPVYANQAVLELEPVLLDRVMVSLMTHLSDDDQQTAYDIADLGNRYQTEAFLHTHIDDFEQVLEHILDQFAQEYLTAMNG